MQVNNFYRNIIEKVIDPVPPRSCDLLGVWNIVCSIFAHLADKFLSLVSTSYCSQKKFTLHQREELERAGRTKLKGAEEIEEESGLQIKSTRLSAVRDIANNVMGAARKVAMYPLTQLFAFYNSNASSTKKIQAGYGLVAGFAILANQTQQAKGLLKNGEKIKAARMLAVGFGSALVGTVATVINWLPGSKLIGN